MLNIILLCLTMAGSAFGADPNAPHPHKGKSEKFSNPQPSKLSAEEIALLKQGKAVRRQVRGKGGGRGIAIMDVNAPANRIWKTILDYKAYPEWIDKLDQTKVYGGTPEAGYLVTFELSVLGMDIVYYIDHDYFPDKGYLTWTLDYTRESDVDDSTGYWLVYPSPDSPGMTRVEYTVDLQLKGWVPGIIENMLAKKGLTKATSWVKQQAE